MMHCLFIIKSLGHTFLHRKTYICLRSYSKDYVMEWYHPWVSLRCDYLDTIMYFDSLVASSMTNIWKFPLYFRCNDRLGTSIKNQCLLQVLWQEICPPSLHLVNISMHEIQKDIAVGDLLLILKECDRLVDCAFRKNCVIQILRDRIITDI